MAYNKEDSYLKAYEIYVPTGTPLVERIFKAIMVSTVGMFLGLGIYFRTIQPEPQKLEEKIRRINTQFLIKEKKVALPEKKIEKPEKKKPKDDVKPVDLTKKPEMGQKEDDIQKKESPKRVRRVYGLRKVYSKGLGAGGALSDAVVGKLGNTLNKDVDTLNATPEDLKGEVVSVTTITSSPRFLKKVKPEYTEEMIKNKIEGVIKVKVLVDIDGKVKKAIALNDLGFGSGERAINACNSMLFEPAMRGNEPVAVWIIIPIKFVLLG